MDLNEAAQRILRRHWLLILLVTIIGVSVPAAMIRMQEDSYVATARIVIGATDTRDGQEATALADAALALATSREVVGRVLTEKGVVRDPSTVVEEVRVEPIGTSGVLEVSVTDADGTASAVMVNALAAEIVRMRDEAVFASTRQALAGTDQQIAAVTQRIWAIESAAQATVAGLGSVDALALQHAQAMEVRSSLDAQRQQLVQALTAAVPPRVVDASSTAGDLVPAALTTRLAIGAVLGIVLGVALAATRESLRPTLSGAAIARHLGAPLLARLRRLPRRATGMSDPWLANYLTLAADAAGVSSVQLVPVGRGVDVTGSGTEPRRPCRAARTSCPWCSTTRDRTMRSDPATCGRAHRHRRGDARRGEGHRGVRRPRAARRSWPAGRSSGSSPTGAGPLGDGPPPARPAGTPASAEAVEQTAAASGS